MSLHPGRSDRIVIFGSMAVMMLAGVLYGLWPMIEARREMRRFCASLVVGQSAVAAQARAEGLGYEIDASVAGRLRLLDNRSARTLACVMKLDAQRNIAAPPALQD